MAYDVGTAFLTVTASFKGIDRELKKVAKQIADDLSGPVSDALPDGVKEGAKRAEKEARAAGDAAGETFAGHFADSLNRRLRSAFKAIPELKIGADSSAAERALAGVRSDFDQLSKQKIGVDIDAATALAAAKGFRSELSRLLDETTDIRLRVDVSQARDELDSWIQVAEAGGERVAREAQRLVEERARIHQQGLDEDLRRDRKALEDRSRLHQQALDEDFRRQRKAAEAAKLEVERLAQEAARNAEAAFSQTWAGRIRKGIQDAFKALPDIEFTPAQNAAEQLAKDLRSQLAGLADQRIGVDIDASAAVAKIAEIKAQLVDLAKSSPNVQVQADAVAAATELTAVERLAERLDGKRVDIAVAADDSAVNRMGDAAQFSLSRLEGLVATSLSLGTVLVPAAAAAASAIGFIGTAAASAAAGIGVMALGFSGVGTAVKALQSYTEDQKKSEVSLGAARTQVANSAASVASAERSLANVRASNADAARRAAGAVQEAERSLARAQVDAKRAQLDLTRAREDARRQLQDMELDLEGLAIAQRQANLDQADAKKDLDKVLKDPKASKEQREQAQLTYDKITLRIKELGVQQKRLSVDQKAAAKAGVEGSRQVVAAQEQVRSKHEAIGQAQRRVVEAQAAQVSQQRQAAFAVAQAQQSVASASASAAQALERQKVAGGEALSTLQTAMEKLSPAGQRFARFIFGLRDEFDGLRDSASSNLLPGVQRSIETLLPVLPRFSDYVGQVASAIGGMFEETAQFLRVDPTWRRFWSHMDSETVPTLERLYRIGRNTATGLLGLYLAFTPFNDDIGGGLESLTERFAKWSAQLETDQGFQKFLTYVQENGPRVVKLIGEMTEFVINFIEAAAPVGTFVVQAFTALFEALNSIPLGVLQAIAIGLAAISAASLAMSAATRAIGLFKSAVDILGGVRDTFGKVTQSIDRAAEGTGRFRDAAIRTKTAGLNLKDGLAGLGSFLAGPWGVAIGGATLAIGYFMQKSAEQKQKVEDLSAALALLGKAYKETRSVSSTAVKDIVAQSKELQTLVVNANRYGVAVETIAKAASGEKDAQNEITGALRTRIKTLEEMLRVETKMAEQGAGQMTAEEFEAAQRELDMLKVQKGALEGQFGALNAATAAQNALDAAQKRTTASAAPQTDAQRKLADQMNTNATRIGVLTGLVDAFSNAQSTGAQRANAMRAAIELQTGAAISAIEAEERWHTTLDGLTASVTNNGTSLAIQSQEGRNNRDALEEAAAAARDRYLADIESGTPMDQATQRHKERIAALVAEADKLGLDKKATDELVAAYGLIPENLQTVYTTKGFRAAFEELQELQVAQLALKQGIPVDQAAKEYRKQQQKGNSFLGVGGLKDGGQVHGPGTGTSDSIPAWLSNREFVEPVASVDYYGTGLFEALRQKRIPREMLPGFAKGGTVQWPARIDLTKTRIPSMAEVRASVASEAAGGPVPAGGLGSQRMMQILRLAFPGLALMSGYRPGDRVASGELSYHARNRAVDLPPRMDVFNWIKAHYPNSRELIHTPGGRRQIWNGREHFFTGADLQAQHYNHVHWAYDQGGMLPPGVSTVLNATGKPEPVLTDQQWSQISALARTGQSGPGGETHHWHFAKADLDHGRLQAWADARDARARAGRPG